MCVCIYIINIYIKVCQPPTGPILYLVKILSSEDSYFSDLIFPILVFCTQPGFLSIKCSLKNSSLALHPFRAGLFSIEAATHTRLLEMGLVRTKMRL